MARTLYQDGMARLEAGDVEQGRRLLEQALREAPESVEVLHGLGQALDLAGERVQAQALWEKANARAPSAVGPACELAMLYLEKEEDARAERVLKPVLEAHPDNTRAHLYMAMALAKTEPERAGAHLEKVLQSPDADEREQAEMLHRVLAGEG